MAENLDILNTTVSLLIRAVLLAARFSGRVRQRYLMCLSSADGTALDTTRSPCIARLRAESSGLAPCPYQPREPTHAAPESEKDVTAQSSGPTVWTYAHIPHPLAFLHRLR